MKKLLSIPIFTLYIVVTACIYNQMIAFHFINKTMIFRYPSAPFPSQIIYKRFRLSESVLGISFDIQISRYHILTQ